jgi:hypothetical protein
MPLSKHRNSWAITIRRKIQKRLNTFKRVMANRAEKIEKANRPRRKPFQGEAKKIAIPVTVLYPNRQFGLYFPGSNFGRNLNQRQKRKRIRQQPHGR